MSDKPPLTKDSPEVKEWFAKWLEKHPKPFVILAPMVTSTSKDFEIDDEKESNWGSNEKQIRD